MTAPLNVREQVDVSGIAEAVRNHLDGAEWDVAIFLADLPRRARLYPISVEVDTAPGRRSRRRVASHAPGHYPGGSSCAPAAGRRSARPARWAPSPPPSRSSA
ncbi:hypothetical protein ACIF80_24980 [Streptomyces sp. NPDC085927]|uniref:hypothetical protein n=1 Tax=Streptomyces sp. NPDC085927 TaxID=3365738 RepID=UPI0037CDDC1C